MTGIHVADCSQSFVVTTDKSRAGADTLRSLQDSPVHLHADFDHRIGFVDVFLRQQLCSARSERILCSGHDCAILVQTSGHVEQCEEHPLTAYAGVIIQSPASPPAIGSSG